MKTIQLHIRFANLSKVVPSPYICKNSKNMKKVLFVLLMLVVLLAIVPLFLPKTMHVEEEHVFDASIESVYNHYNDLTKFTQFDAWSQMDPDIKINYSSPAIGEGASYKWESQDRNLGTGSMTISESKLNEFVLYDLQFGDMTGNTTEAIFQRLDDGKTRVIWSFDSGESGYPYQIFNVLMNGTVKDNLKKGFANLESLLQKDSSLDNDNKDINNGGFMLEERPAQKLFGVIQQTSTDSDEIETAMSETFGLVRSYLVDANSLTEEQIGKPVVLWKQFDVDSETALFYCGFFVNENVPEVDDFEFINVPGGKYLTTIHQGSYRTLDITYEKLYELAAVQNLEISNNTYDVYLNDASTTEEKDLRTQIFVPVLN